MDVDEMLEAIGLPDVTVDAEAALARTLRRGRTRRQRLVAATACTSLLLIVGLGVAVAELTDRHGSTDVAATGPATSLDAPEQGDAAVWDIDPAAPVNGHREVAAGGQRKSPLGLAL